MSEVHGELIKEKRKTLGLTQKQLAQDICKQATISNIENKNYCFSAKILTLICQRLNIPLQDVLIISEDSNIKAKLDQIEQLCKLNQNSEAIHLLNQIDMNAITDSETRTKYLYYKAGLTFLVEQNPDSAFFYYNQVLANTNKDDLYALLSKLGIAIIYTEKGETNFAQSYFESLIDTVNNENKELLDYNKIYYNAAKFFSSKTNYQYALTLCNQGIELNQIHNSTELLEQLLYERAYNAMKSNDPKYLNFFYEAAQIAKFRNNQHIIQTIEKNLQCSIDQLSVIIIS
ncbi:helix-turn-helix domain-containing protein [Lapidilactobacillus bayanensis]|uniref:helix-turn-helix domain-containing protein n=1 Tax=Lapidilactobacillus bayanensis TaxID=2485998 RepID=UPI0013DE1888|nr:helix-turn-helix domain-containing protein [Lapidilactobacillus bayanensis]